MQPELVAVKERRTQHFQLLFSEGFITPKSIPQVEGTLYILQLTGGTKIRKKSKCTPSLKMQCKPFHHTAQTDI